MRLDDKPAMAIIQRLRAVETRCPVMLAVFAASPKGGNPAPIVADASGMSDADMQHVARLSGHESAFVLPPPEGSEHDFEIRFWVPNHEMEMCGHATVGAVWLLHHLGRLPRRQVSILTRSGTMQARVIERRGSDVAVEVTQPAATIEPIPDRLQSDVLAVLGVGPADLTGSIRNACTSRVKTLVPLRTALVLGGLRPCFEHMERLCDRLGSTGLYPYARSEEAGSVFEARQFPKSSGYPEDAATGIAAAALAFGLLQDGSVSNETDTIQIRQGVTMGRPSQITVRFSLSGDSLVDGCWIGGTVRLQDSAI